ncbi:MAG: hypothetical protein ACI9XZ_003595, partial [Alphaproteobacteria bacterium]
QWHAGIVRTQPLLLRLSQKAQSICSVQALTSQKHIAFN